MRRRGSSDGEHQHTLAEAAQGVGATERAPHGFGRGQAAAPAHERSAELDHPSPTRRVDDDLVAVTPEPLSRTPEPSDVKPAAARTSAQRSFDPATRGSVVRDRIAFVLHPRPRQLDVAGVEVVPDVPAIRSGGGDQCRAAAHERVEHEVVRRTCRARSASPAARPGTAPDGRHGGRSRTGSATRRG